jgi:hypothetical protein
LVLNLAGAFPDPLDPCIAQMRSSGKSDINRCPVNLNRFIGDGS